MSDHIGAFVVTAGPEEIAIAERFEAANDDYSSILVKALADRIAEALAEYMHARVRRELWGYAPDEAFTPAGADRRAVPRHPSGARLPGPARPHREGHDLRTARRRARIGVGLTESYAMWPGSSVSGLYFAHPDAKYFAVGQRPTRPGRELRRTQGHHPRTSRTTPGSTLGSARQLGAMTQRERRRA